MTENHLHNREDFKFLIANHMQSFASLLLSTLLDKKQSFNNNNNNTTSHLLFSTTTEFNSNAPLAEQHFIEQNCRSELITLSSGALRNEQWSLRVFDSNARLQAGMATGSLFNSIGNYEQCLSSSSMASVHGISGIKYCLAQIDLTSEARHLSELTGLASSVFSPSDGGRAAKFALCVPTSCSNNDLMTIFNNLVRSTFTDTNLLINQLDCVNHLPNYSDDNFQESSASPTSDRFGLFFTAALFLIILIASISATVLDSIKVYDHFVASTEHQIFGFHNKYMTKFIKTFIESFSLIKNFNKLFEKRQNIILKKLNRKSFSSLNLKSLDGLRVISMFWIITIHSYNFAFQWLMFDNIEHVDDVYKTIYIQWLSNGTFSVDNFFLISGLLSCLKLVKLSSNEQDDEENYRKRLRGRNKSYCFNFNKNKKQQSPPFEVEMIGEESECKSSSAAAAAKNKCSLEKGRDQCIELKRLSNDNEETNTNHNKSSCLTTFKKFLLIICDRYLRLIPILMFMILFSTTILSHLSYGPNWSISTRMFDQWCRTNWYWNIVMLQNIFNTPNMCFSHSWYIAADFQLFIFLLIIFKVQQQQLIKWSINKFCLLGTFILLAQSITSIITYLNKLPGVPLIPAESVESILNYYKLIYIKPYYWLSSYFIGILSAYFLILISSSELNKFKLKGRIVFFLQLLSLVIMSFVLISTLPYFNGTLFMSNYQASIYTFFARPLWSSSVACLILISILSPKYMTERNLLIRFIKSLLNSHFWLPLSRLSYSAYLLHPVIISIFYGSRIETFQFNHLLLIYFTIGNICITYVASMVLCLLVEYPIKSIILEFKLLNKGMI